MDPSKLLDAPDPMELAIAKAMSDDLPIPLAQIVDPTSTAPEWLPFLAASTGVKLWFSDWSTDRKRLIIQQWPELAEMVGTHECAVRLLEFVDAEVIDKISYPARFVTGKSAANVTPLDFPAFKARYLVKVLLERPINAFEAGRSAVGMAAVRKTSDEPVRRAKQALLISKAAETEYTINTAWRQNYKLRDEATLGDECRLSGFKDRSRF